MRGPSTDASPVTPLNVKFTVSADSVTESSQIGRVKVFAPVSLAAHHSVPDLVDRDEIVRVMRAVV